MKKLIKTMSVMYAIYISLLVVLSFTGCASTKKLAKTKSDIALASDLESKKKVDETTNVKTSASGETASSKNTESSENQSKETETKTTKYDPSKPIVPGTGKPPVVEETTTKEKTLSQKDNKMLEETRTKNNLLIQENKRLKQSNDSILRIKATENTKSEMKVSKYFPWWIWFLSGMVLMGLIWAHIHFKKPEAIYLFLKSIFSFFV